MTSSNDNGGRRDDDTAEVFVLDRLVLTYDRARDHLEIGGKCNSLDLMLDMLARATRTLEAQLRAENAIKLQQQMREIARGQEIAASLRRGG